MSAITYDWSGPPPPPGPGDALVCVSRKRPDHPTGTAYLILEAHEVQRIEPVPGEIRMRYVVARITLPEAVATPRWEGLTWNPR